MKQILNRGTLLFALLLILGLAYVFRGHLLPTYDRTMVQIPDTKNPSHSIPVPASITEEEVFIDQAKSSQTEKQKVELEP